MKYLIIFFLFIITLFSFKNTTTLEWKKNNEKSSFGLNIFQNTTIQEIQQTDSIPELWNEIVFKKGGCLGGQQYVKKLSSKRKIKRLVFSETDWNLFLDFDKTELTDFLIKQLSDTTKTKIHTCPFFNATNGEMAVYSLQQIHNKNWYDFEEFLAYKNKDYTSGTDQPQTWLQNILIDKFKREKLAELFQKELNN
ncbi:MAG: hypothetical protein KUG68_02360 [Flavobacteriaceae bacterium]|nr:hypothetical protein [Flavobacteriaceae bacterium]